MSALRFSGEVRVRLTYIEPRCGTPDERKIMERYPNGQYRCVVAANGYRAVVWTAPPATLLHAVDSSEAFDDAASAAIAFAAEEHGSLADVADYGPDGLVVTRYKV